MTNTYQLLLDEMTRTGDNVNEVVSSTTAVEKLKEDHGCGSFTGGYTIWTKTRIYFPSTSEAFFDVQSVPRNPCDEVCGVMY